MVAKALLVLCAQALLIQSITAQCLASLGALGTPCGIGPLVAGPGACGYAAPARGLSASNGPGLAIASASSIPPVGVSVASENAIEGILEVAGLLPFLGTVGLEGVLPTAGAGNVAYNCGNGAVAITAEDVGVGIGSLGLGAPALGLGVGPLGLGANSLGLGAGPLGLGIGGCGCGAIL